MNYLTFVTTGSILYICVEQVLEEAGFVNVVAEDRTEQFMEVLKNELNRTEAIKEEFINVSNIQ